MLRKGLSLPLRAALLCLLGLWVLPVFAQSADAPQASDRALYGALVGTWVGVLEYRDYSEPATSTKRVQLPTWLTIRPAPEGVFLETTYDDGPSKTVFEHEALVVDRQQRIYKSVGTDATLEVYKLDDPGTSHGVFVLHGAGKENGKPSENRITWTVRRNLISWLEETRPAGSSDPFVFRHLLTVTRATAPKATTVQPR